MEELTTIRGNTTIRQKVFDPLHDPYYVIEMAESETIFMDDETNPTFASGYIYENKIFFTRQEVQAAFDAIHEKYCRYIHDNKNMDCVVWIYDDENHKDGSFFVVSRTNQRYIQTSYSIKEISARGTEIHEEYFDHFVERK